MNRGRVALAFTILPLVLLLERASYWGGRSFLALHLTGTFASSSSISVALTASAILSAVLLVSGAAVAVVTGPAIPVAAGIALSVLSNSIFALSSSEVGIWSGLVVGALGQGLYRPCIWALAAIELAEPREHLRNLSFVVLYAATNVAALIAPALVGSIAPRLGARGVFGISAAVAAVAFVFAVGLALGWHWIGRSGQANAASPPAFRFERLALGALGLTILAGLYTFSLSVFSDVAHFRALSGGASFASRSLLFSVNPIAVVTISLLVIPMLLAFHFLRVRATSFHLIAVGLTLLGLSVIPLLLAPSSTLPQIGTQVGIGIAEVFTGPILGARIAGDVPARFAPAFIALWQFGTGAAAIAANSLALLIRKADLIIAGVLALALFALGAVSMFVAGPIVRAIYVKDETEPRADPEAR